MDASIVTWDASRPTSNYSMRLYMCFKLRITKELELLAAIVEKLKFWTLFLAPIGLLCIGWGDGCRYWHVGCKQADQQCSTEIIYVFQAQNYKRVGVTSCNSRKVEVLNAISCTNRPMYRMGWWMPVSSPGLLAGQPAVFHWDYICVSSSELQKSWGC